MQALQAMYKILPELFILTNNNVIEHVRANSSKITDVVIATIACAGDNSNL